MDFYERQAAARRQSRWLVAAFAGAIAVVVGMLTTLLVGLLVSRGESGLTLAQRTVSEPALTVSVALFWLLVIMGASVFRSLGLREGGGVVARSLGGTRVDRSTTDPDLRRLRNVVEEMAIASGVPVPEIYVLDAESAINAFAAGHAPANAAIAVTRGTLTSLTREELQGVIAHEFSHILNGDMRLNIRMIGWLFGLMVIALLGRMLLRLAPNSRKAGAGVVVMGLALFALGSVGRFLGQIIQASVSRQRERLADASAVQFTRNPGGLKGALLKIASWPAAGRLASARVDEVAHMLFVPGLNGLLATHPPMAERIVALDPGFRTERLAEVAAEYRRSWERLAQSQSPTNAQQGSSAQGTGLQRLETLLLSAVAAEVADQVGHPDTVQIALAHELRLALPEAFREGTESPSRARALLLATLAARDPAHRAAQQSALVATLGARVGEEFAASTLAVAELPPLLRLPAVCQLFPALRRLSKEERVQLVGLIARLAAVDHDIDVFEFCLHRLVYNTLLDELEARDEHGSGLLSTSFHPLGILFAVLAERGAAAGSAGADEIRKAFAAGMNHVLPGPRRPELAVPADWPKRLWAALSRLETLQPQAKRRLVEGLVMTIAHDQLLTVAEAELLRTVCAVLRCPLPPLLPGPAPGPALV